MKKTISVIGFLMFAMVLRAQVTVDDFESGDKGWKVVSCWADIRDNEQKTGLNLSDKVLYVIRATGCDNWSGAIYTLPQTISGYKYLHAYMYRNNTGVPNIKVNDNTGTGVSCEGNGMCDLTPLTTTKAGEWQDVVWDISQYESAGISFIFFMVDRADLTADAWMLVDNIELNNDATPRTVVIGGQEDEQEEESDGTYKLVWQDDFTGSSLDLEMWNIEVNGDGGGNNELQYYCEKAVSVQDGNLVLTATKENYNGKDCTSGRITTLGKVYFTYGKVEARIKMPNTANGLWPAFWMMGNDINAVGWPACGETDIVEMGNVNGINAGTQGRYFNGAMHWGTAWDAHQYDAQDKTLTYSVQDGEYHLFTCVWDKETVKMYVDQDKYPTVAPYFTKAITYSADNSAAGYYFHKPNFILFNLAVGGQYPSIYNINGITALADGPRSMQIDWVRVYQKGDSGETFTGKNTLTHSAVEDVQPNAAVLRIWYYDLQGRRVSEQATGLLIRLTEYADGYVKAEKVLR